VTYTSLLLLYASGIITGGIGALLGLGGGVFLIPFLVLVFDLQYCRCDRNVECRSGDEP